MTEVVPNLIIAQMHRGHIAVFGQAADTAEIATMNLFGEPEELHVIDDFFYWINHDIPLDRHPSNTTKSMYNFEFKDKNNNVVTLLFLSVNSRESLLTQQF